VARLGRYEITKPIASGGMATVYLARVVGAGGFERPVAVKSMHASIAADPEFVAMFLDEARLAARLRHPNAVATIDVQENPLFLVMEYVEGPSLHAVMRAMRREGQRIPLGIALRVFLDILDGLHAAHELTGADGQPLHLVHRDVSPHNMLIGVDGISRITDFGVARAESRLSSTRGGQVKGKIAYMAPEQVRSEEVDRRADVYAAGAVLWEMLAGRSRYTADNEAALLAQVLAGDREPPTSVVPDIPETLSAACMRALAMEADARQPSAAALAEEVEHAATAAGVAIATARAVGSFVRVLGVHERPDAPPRTPTSDLAVLDMEGAPPPTAGSSTVAVLPAGPRRKSSRMPFVIAAAAGLVLGVTTLVVMPRGERSPAGASAPSSPTDAERSGAGRVAPSADVAAPAAPPAPAASAAAPPPSASASTTPSAAPSAAPSALPGSSPVGPRPRPASGAPTTFRPADL
jgi:serine/threonine protein kinase